MLRDEAEVKKYRARSFVIGVQWLEIKLGEAPSKRLWRLVESLSNRRVFSSIKYDVCI
jgi:hypothetical protein